MNEIPTRTMKRHGARGRAMAFPGLLLSVAVITMTMVGLVLASESLRVGTAELQTRATLRTLRAALLTFQARHDEMPPGPAPAAIGALLADPLAAPIVRTVQLALDNSVAVCVRDGYGRPLRYIIKGTDAHGTATADFVSVGFDGILGDPTSRDIDRRRCAIDDIYGADVEMSQGGEP